MNSRELTPAESETLRVFREAANDFALIYLTATGLKKSILDATIPLRALLKQFEIHDYASQGQGPECKRVIEIAYLAHDKQVAMSTSLYRPITKVGDPRIWFSGLPGLAKPDDVLVFFISRRTPYIANLTHLATKGILEGSWLGRWLAERREETFTVAMELLARLREIAARGPLTASCKGDTAIGRAIETALGIPMNSRRVPDYQGIEIKAKRTARQDSRYTLFAQVADWTLSDCKSSAAILEQFGYLRDGVFKLYCEVSTLKPNSQGLQFRLVKSTEELIEHTKAHPRVAVWELSKLHGRLLEKHPETFWIQAKSEDRKGTERFTLIQAVHTRQPSVAQFDDLLERGIITMDHLIKRKDKGAHEKGPLFKIETRRLNDLFLSAAKTYPLG